MPSWAFSAAVSRDVYVPVLSSKLEEHPTCLSAHHDGGSSGRRSACIILCQVKGGCPSYAGLLNGGYLALSSTCDRNQMLPQALGLPQGGESSGFELKDILCMLKTWP